MPTYEDLRTYFNESEALQGVVRQAADIPIVSGFTLDIHPLWTLLYDLEEGAIGDDGLRKFLLDRYFYRMIETPIWPYTDWPVPTFQGYRRRDLNRKVAIWSDLRRFGRKLGKSPVVMTIVHRPVRTPVGDVLETDETDRARLIALANSAAALVLVDERPVATLAFAPGDGIATNQGHTGTYGGTLTNPAGKAYGMSCAHVAEKGDTIDDGAGLHLGTCKDHTTLFPLGAGVVCDPSILPMPNPYPGNGPSVNMLDVSLIELATTPTSARTLSGVATSLTIGQDVDVDGALTKAKCRLGSLAISYAFVTGGKTYCFRDSIELKPRPRFGLGGGLGTLFSPLPVQGDSGAWVLTMDATPAWAGIFFAEDGQRGFCIRAKWAHDWAEGLVGSLSV
ncbi:hypothetical protein GCM10011349_29610 [Novosphingobium indicum]|uniref:Uncharacterized protein n=1 Tax=Novosphingobium indicum TaxID=462949 RepID=A0ABQ2JQG7_9SPHN|nr:hypothetical protein [Novosphingobium indicum]GGN54186.1 hypothetical protein GCM10011349_29610 [Novosphingobium indicum]